MWILAMQLHAFGRNAWRSRRKVTHFKHDDILPQLVELCVESNFGKTRNSEDGMVCP